MIIEVGLIKYITKHDLTNKKDLNCYQEYFVMKLIQDN